MRLPTFQSLQLWQTCIHFRVHVCISSHGWCMGLARIHVYSVVYMYVYTKPTLPAELTYEGSLLRISLA